MLPKFFDKQTGQEIAMKHLLETFWIGVRGAILGFAIIGVVAVGTDSVLPNWQLPLVALVLAPMLNHYFDPWHTRRSRSGNVHPTP